jgi:DNA primase
MSVIDEIKARIDIVDLVSETVKLRRSGKNYTGFCPFHANTRSPAFAVFSDSGTWRCFGQCNEGGDIFKFVMKKEGWEFSEALRYLADRAGVQLHAPTPQEQAMAEEHATLRTLLEDSVVFYHHQLLHTPQGKPALEYLREKRHLKDETIEAFGLGYAPSGWDVLINHFKTRGRSEEELLEAGLVTSREDRSTPGRPSIYDRFRNRIMFPIRDERGRMAGFGARILDPNDVPKFLNSPQTPIFDKGHLLYGLDRARKAIREAEEAIIVEGYLDVIVLHQAGFRNAVSPMGTALTGHHLGLVKRLARRIVLALDPDAAGSQATLRGLQVARQTLEHSSDPVFDAQGLLRHESRLEADIRVMTLPEGQDPDEVVERDPQLWANLVKEARPVVIHVMETLAQGLNLDDPKIKTDLARQVLPLIQDVPDPIERDAYRQRLARLLRVSERTLLEILPQSMTSTRKSPGRAGQPSSRNNPTGEPENKTASTSPMMAGRALEAHCLGVFLRSPDLLYQVDRRLQEDGLSRLTIEDFRHSDHQTIFRLLEESLDQDMAEPLQFILGSLDLELMDVADSILAQTAHLDTKQERVLEDLLRGILDLRRRRLYQDLDYLRFLQEEIQVEGDLRTQQYGQLALQYSRTKMLLDKAYGRYTSHTTSPRQEGLTK